MNSFTLVNNGYNLVWFFSEVCFYVAARFCFSRVVDTRLESVMIRQYQYKS